MLQGGLSTKYKKPDKNSSDYRIKNKRTKKNTKLPSSFRSNSASSSSFVGSRSELASPCFIVARTLCPRNAAWIFVAASTVKKAIKKILLFLAEHLTFNF